MSIFVYVTEKCESEAKDHSIVDQVERFKSRVEKAQSAALFHPFRRPLLEESLRITVSHDSTYFQPRTDWNFWQRAEIPF